MSYLIVVSRFDENIEWTKQYENVLIFNKGLEDIIGDNVIKLENVGKENHTYYKYIYDNYDDLPDFIIFLKSEIEIKFLINNITINNYNVDFKTFSDMNINCNLNGCKYHSGLPLREVYNYLFEKDLTDDFAFSPGSQFLVSKSRILNKSRDFYLRIVNLLNKEVNPIEYYVIERFHELIFKVNIYPVYNKLTSSYDYMNQINLYIENSPKNEIHNNLFIGRDIILSANIYNDSPKSNIIFILFNYAHGAGSLCLDGSNLYYNYLSSGSFGGNYFKKNKLNHINIYNTNNHWWQTWEMNQCIDLIKKINIKYSFTNIITYGASHGATGALLFSDILKVNFCIALWPRTIFYEDILLRSGYHEESKKLGLVKIYETKFNKICKYIICYGKRNKIDSSIIDSFISKDFFDFDNISIYDFNTNKHPFLEELNSLNFLKSIIDNITNDNFEDINKMYLKIKDIDLD